MNTGRALYLSYDGLLEPLGASQVVPLLEGLSRRGFAMEVLSFEKPGDLDSPTASRELGDRLREAGVRWHMCRYHGRPSLPATGFDVWKGQRVVERRAREVQGRLLVHARSYVAGTMGLRAVRGLRGSTSVSPAWPRFLFDMRGFWVDERLEAGRWREGSIRVRAARRAERRLLEEADWLVHLSHSGMEKVGRLAPEVKLPPGSVIPTFVDLARFHPTEDKAAARRDLGLGEGPIIIHIGTLSGWYLGAETFRLARGLIQKRGGEFVVLTREVDLARDLARSVGVRARIRTVGHADVPQWLGASDVGLCLVRPGFAKTASTPTKIGEYLAAGLVVVGTRGVGDLEDQFRRSPVALLLEESSDGNPLADRVLSALAREDRELEARRLAERYFNLENGIEAYAEIYRSLGMTP